MKKLLRKKLTLALLFVVLIGGGLVYWQTALGVNRTWDGGGVDGTCGGAGTANNWSCAANWSGDTVPTSADVAIFDGTSTKNATINSDVNVAGISINVGYTGTITQSSTFTVTVGGSHYSQAAGTFTGGSGAIDINGTFTLSGGTFTSTSGTLEVGHCPNANVTFLTVSAGTFNHNNGTVSFTCSSGGFWLLTYTVDVASTLTLYNIIVNITSGSKFNYLTTAIGDTVTAAGNFTQTDSRLEGAWEVQGNVIIGAGANGGLGTLTYTTAGAHTYAYTAGGVGPRLGINHASATVSAAGGTTDLTLSGFTLSAGTFTAPSGALQVGAVGGGSSGFNECPAGSGTTFFTVASGATLNHNNGTVSFTCSGGGNWGRAFTIDVATSLTLYDVEVNFQPNSSSDTISVAEGDTLVIARNFTHTNSALAGTWEVQGNYTVATTADGGTAGITFTGGNNQTYTDAGGDETNGDVLINKSGNTVTLASNADWNAASQDLTVTAGTLASATYNITTVNFTVNGGTFTGGSGTVTTSGPMLVSSGTFTGGVGDITVNNTFTLSGGVFTSTSGILTIAYSGGNTTIFTISGGTFNHNNGTVYFNTGVACNATYAVDVATTQILYNVTVNLLHTCEADYLVVASGDTIVVSHDFTQTNGTLVGTWEVQGNYTVGAGADGGTAGITFTGGNAQVYTDQGGNESDGDITINKTSGSSVTLASNADWNAASQDVTITSGELNMGASYNISTTALTVSTDGHLSNNGTGDLTLAGNVSNSGNIRFRSSGTCGGTDSISIASSVGGVQRTWSGTGTYLFHDVNVQDQGGSAAITAYSSTSVSGNGVNWTFSGAACPAQPPAAGISTGKMNMLSGKINLQ
ncbi:MAG: hypothetical protein WAT41_02060 [Flavobacteriales bacterium]